MDFRDMMQIMNKPVADLTVSEIEDIMERTQKTLDMLHNNNGPDELKEGYQSYLGELVTQYKKKLHIK
jgi:hypothetical protein